MEDEGRHDDRALGALGTLVIADHNGCFQPNVQPLVRFTQSAAASFSEDSLTQFNEARRVAATTLAAASWDHAAVQQSSNQAAGDARLSPAELSLSLRDPPRVRIVVASIEQPRGRR